MRCRLLLLALPLALGLAACDRPEPAETPVPPADEPAAEAHLTGTVTYREREALPEGARAVVLLRERGDATRVLARTTVDPRGRQVPLPFELAAEADPTRALVLDARIEADGRVLWVTREPVRAEPGVELVLEPTGATEPIAPEPLEEARRAGVTFRAVGQEPGWLLDVYGDPLRPERIVYRTHYATETHTFERIARQSTDDAVTFRAEGLEVVVRDRPCRDTMSGEPFPATVSVRHAGRTAEGCGRPLD